MSAPAPLCRRARRELANDVAQIRANGDGLLADVLAKLLEESERADRAERLVTEMEGRVRFLEDSFENVRLRLENLEGDRTADFTEGLPYGLREAV